jgi:hypothetical protein
LTEKESSDSAISSLQRNCDAASRMPSVAGCSAAPSSAQSVMPTNAGTKDGIIAQAACAGSKSAGQLRSVSRQSRGHHCPHRTPRPPQHRQAEGPPRQHDQGLHQSDSAAQPAPPVRWSSPGQLCTAASHMCRTGEPGSSTKRDKPRGSRAPSWEPRSHKQQPRVLSGPASRASSRAAENHV